MTNLNASEQIIDYIKENILNASFKIGSKLPSERKIAEQFNISHIPVWKAIGKPCQEEIVIEKRIVLWTIAVCMII